MAESWLRAQEDFFAHPSDLLLDCSFAEENIAGFALGALSPDESFRIAQHLSWCPSCARLLHEERKTVGYLPFLSPQAAPRAAVKLRLFDRIEADQQLKGTPLATATPLLTVRPDVFEDRDGPLGHTIASDTAPSKQKPGKRRFSWELAAAPLAAVPLVVVLAIVGGWALRTQDKLDHQSAQTHNLETQNAQLAAQVTLLSNGLESSQARRFDLDSGDAAVGGSAGGSLVAIADQTWASLSVWNLPQTAAGYEVLMETKTGDMQPAGVFSVDQNGKASIQLKISSPLMDYQAVHVQPKATDDRTAASDSVGQEDILWMDLDGNLGGQAGTEANAKAH